MNKIRLISAAAIAFAALIYFSGDFGVNAELRACQSKDRPDTRIVAICTALLERDDIKDEVRARALFRRALAYERGDDPAAERDYLSALEIRPNWAGLHLNLGLIYQKQGEHSKALPYFDKAWALYPGYARRTTRANTYYDLGRYEEALADADTALTFDPNNLWARLVRARSLRKMENYDAAVESYSKLILLDTGNARARRERAWIYYKMQRLSYHAEVDLRHVLARDSDDYRAWAQLGYVLLRRDRYTEAADALERALSIKPGYKFARRGLDRAETEVEERRQRNARLSTPEGRTLAGPAFGTLLARNFVKVGETARALAENDAVLASDPDNVFAHAGKARIYYDTGNYAAAIASNSDFFAAVATQEDEAKMWGAMIDRMHAIRGNSHNRLGNAGAALAAWTKALEKERTLDVSLWQLRLQSAGYYNDWPDGESDNAFFDGLAACAIDPACLH
ncbi:hypothetical protein RA26_10535 [Leisingera sp. ANG-M7]|nr:hypothetical protein RA26_10535 [Leisingera sp. ANG-M7]